MRELEAASSYRCAYCGSPIKERFAIASHEAGCEAKTALQAMWSRMLERARQRETRQQRRCVKHGR